MADIQGKALARELIHKSREEGRNTLMEAVIQATRGGSFRDEQTSRPTGQLWTLEHMFYDVYGGRGQGLEINNFPPSVKCLFSGQNLDESTHGMLYGATFTPQSVSLADQKEVST